MLGYAEDLNHLISPTAMRSSDPHGAETQLGTLEFRWKAFLQNAQEEIADSEYLMELMSQVEQLTQAAKDSIAMQQKRCDAMADLVEAEKLLYSQDTVYKALYKEAMRFSLVKQLAPRLEKLKSKEQAMFQKIDASYSKTKEVAQLLPQMAGRCANLDEEYYALKALSGKIQALEYKPPLQRAKDWLMSLACVAMILVFINMATTKIKAAKKAREMLKKQKEFFDKANPENNYPTI